MKTCHAFSFMSTPQRVGGLTLIELMIAIVIAAVLLAMAIPSFTSTQERNRLRGAAKIFANEMRLAQSESLKTGKSTYVAFPSDASQTNWCYGRSEASGCNCSSASCGYETHVASFPNITADPSVAEFHYDPRRGTVTAGNVKFTSASGENLWVVMSDFGRIRICTNASYTECANVN